MRSFAAAIDAIAQTSSRLEKTALLAAYLRSLASDDLVAAAGFLTGSPLGPGEAMPGIGGRTIADAAATVFNLDATARREAYREHGDLSEALASLWRPTLELGFFHEDLTPSVLAARLREAAAASGKNAALKRRAIVEGLLRACTDGREVAAVVKTITGELRIGSREGLIVDAIAKAFEQTPQDVRTALAACGDAGMVAAAARAGTLSEIKPSYGIPLGFMLASPMLFASEYREIGETEWRVEDKLDGIRAQLHVTQDGVRIFSRGGGEITRSFPEIRDAFAACGNRMILDGEILASHDGTPLPFRTLQARLARKTPSDELIAEIPVIYFAFDVLAVDDEMLIDLPLSERRMRLESFAKEIDCGKGRIAPSVLLPERSSETIEAAFAAARARGHEGLMFKRADSAYTPGRRGKSWIKLKQELDTLDVVVVGVEWGHGKRAKMLSDYTFAVRGPEGLLTIGKAYSGLTDAEITELTPWFLEHKTGMLNARAIAVEPELVIEIAFDVVQPSDINESGYSLRFPRIVTLRRDRSPETISTIDDVHEIYRLMIEREAGSADGVPAPGDGEA